MNNSNTEFTMDDASYKAAMQVYSNGQGGFNLKGLQSEIPTPTNTPTFNATQLGEWAVPYNELGMENYTRLADEENKNIRKRNEAIISKYKALQSTATQEEIAALDHITDPAWRETVTNELLKGNPKIKEQLKNLYDAKEWQAQKQKAGEIFVDGNLTLDDFENFTAMYLKQHGHTANVDSHQAFVNSVRTHTKANFQYDPNSNKFFLIDKLGNTHVVEPGIGDHLGAWAFDSMATFITSDLGWRIITKVAQTGITVGGRTIGGGVTIGSGGTGIIAGIGIIAASEAAAAAIPTALDASTKGKLGYYTNTLPRQIVAKVTGDPSENFYLEAFKNIHKDIGYPDVAQNIIQEAAFGAAGGAVMQGAREIYKGGKFVVDKTKPLRERASDLINSENANVLKQSVAQKAKDRTKLVFSSWSDVTKDTAITVMHNQMRLTDNTLTRQQAIDAARQSLSKSGLAGVEVKGVTKTVDELEDWEVAYLMLQTNDRMNDTLMKTVNKQLNTAERERLYGHVTNTVTDINKRVVDIAKNGLDNATARNWIERLLGFESATEELIRTSIRAFASGDAFKGASFTLKGDLANSIHKIFGYKTTGNGKITTFFSKEADLDSLGADSALTKNMETSNMAQGGKIPHFNPETRTRDFIDLEYNVSAEDLLKMRFELMARGDDIAKNFAGGKNTIRNLIHEIDGKLKSANPEGYEALIKTFKENIDDVTLARNTISGLKLTNNPNLSTISDTTIGQFTESILKNANNNLPSVQQFARILSPDGSDINTIAAKIETNLVNHIITKGLDNSKIDAKGVLSWLSSNSGKLVTPEGKIMADFATSSLQYMNKLETMAGRIAAQANPNMSPSTALTSNLLGSLAVFLNRIQILNLTKVGGWIFKTDASKQRHLAESFSNFIANPMDINAIKGVRNAVADEGTRRVLQRFTPDQLKTMSKEQLDDAVKAEVSEITATMGQISSVYNDFATNPQAVIEMAQRMAQQNMSSIK